MEQVFQSTLPMRGATFEETSAAEDLVISIHAPHGGSDGGRVSGRRYPGDFNPRSPCGERQAGFNVTAVTIIFQSTLPMRGATSV